MTCSSRTTRRSAGAILRTDEAKVILGTSLTYYRCNPTHILPEYLAHYMRSFGFKTQYMQVMRQSTRNQVPITKQREFFHVIPPLVEQKRIIGVLDGLFENGQRLASLLRAQACRIGGVEEVAAAPSVHRRTVGTRTMKALTVQATVGSCASARRQGHREPLLAAAAFGLAGSPCVQPSLSAMLIFPWHSCSRPCHAGLLRHLRRCPCCRHRRQEPFEMVLASRRWLNQYGWVLADVTALKTPISCKGALGLWEVSPKIFREIQRQLSKLKLDS